MDPPCHECIKGTIHKGQPQGKEELIHNLNTYVIGNRTNPKAIIVMYSDIFGLPLPNNRLIADAYAKSGDYLVYLPDFFEGDPVPLKAADILIPVDPSKLSTFSKYGGMLASAPSFMMWLTRHKDGPTNKTCMDFLEALRRENPHTKVGMVGFCWGGRYAIRAAREENMIEIGGTKKPLVDAVVALHPSNLAFPDDVAKPVVPVSIGWGLEDVGVKIEQKGKVEAIHDAERKTGREMPELENRLYEPGRHGFAVRGNPDDPKERKALEDSVTQVLDWFGKFL
ncbi:dienelactone hydrolase family protein [Pochonia chlamydosporia 170]|uniref:Dienelactone hydrolase family protein n=1 Tax=Pochonia chlamydosporia 170 TaxID=1380566 RepID=A0A179FIS4_METCM|nr:dienelactone hydrolase family protein [Pochonia chlamydosporia 170]OAQ65198.1 dienelactone hydrolase family protein [Pochonia chlamydosporia 170]